MARYPGARWRPVARYQPGGSSCQPMARYDGGIDHTWVGSPSSDAAFAHCNTSGTPIPHFMVFRDGSIDQYVDTKFRSSACLDGNPRLIAWETADGFPDLWSAGQAPEDTPVMVTSKAKLMAWLHKEHGIPLSRMPSSLPHARGFGWHRLGIDGNFEQAPGQLLGGRVSGGESWSLSAGKTCPTSRRIHQFVEETIPAAVALTKPPPKKPTGPTVTIVHASGKASKPAASAAQISAALDAYVKDGGDVITLTEVASAEMIAALVAWAKANDFHLYHPLYKGQRECAILSRPPLTAVKAQPLTDVALPNGRAPLSLISAHVKGGPWVAVWHSPAHSKGLKPGNAATRIYRAALIRLRAARMRLKDGGGVVLDGDWNLRPELVEKAIPFPHLKWAGDKDQKPTQGGRVIDGFLTNLQVVTPAETLHGQPGFDHKAVRVVLSKKKRKG